MKISAQDSTWQKLRLKLKSNESLLTAKRWLFSRLSGKTGKSYINILSAFPTFAPLSVGNYKANAALTVSSVNSTIPNMQHMAECLGADTLDFISIQEFSKSEEELSSALELKKIFNLHGSDKGDHHGYHIVYGTILARIGEVRNLLEVGLGTNNTDVVSNMGKAGTPGASLRAFRDFLPCAKIFGADIDERILFSEERIRTYFVDQTKRASFVDLGENLPDEFDLIIDDGLHSPDANVNTLAFGLGRLSAGGWMVIEDIRMSAFPVWAVVSKLLPKSFECVFVNADGIGMFVVHRRLLI